MADSFSPDVFYESAREFAGTALEAHHAGNYRRVPLDAGTALEHLAKACLASRSPALLAEMRGDAAVGSLIRLLQIQGARKPAKVRTIGLTEALGRMDLFVTSAAAPADLATLVEIRNGVVHAASDEEVEERILAAFAQHVEALLKDLGRDRAEFWGGQVGVVDALLADASDKLAHRVRVKIAAAEASYEKQYAGLTAERAAILRAARDVAWPLAEDRHHRRRTCPVCGWNGIAAGGHEVVWDVDYGQDGEVEGGFATVWFEANRFTCAGCGLRLDSYSELDAAGIDVWSEVEDADFRDYEEPVDEDAMYEAYRDARDEREMSGPGWVEQDR